MQTIQVRTTQNVLIRYPVASIGDRILAFLLDRVILSIYLIVMIALFVNLDVREVWLWLILVVAPFLFYNLAFEIFMNGQSPGKHVMKIQVVKLDGTQPTIGSYLLRWIFAFVDLYLLSGAIAVIVIAATGKGQRLGDIVAGTSVIKLTAKKEITADSVFISPEEHYAPVFPQVIQLESRDIELIRRALEAHKNFGNQQPVLMVTEKVKSLLGIRTELPPDQFLYTIVKDYHHLTSR